MEKKKAIMRKVLSCFFILVILMGVVPISAFASANSNISSDGVDNITQLTSQSNAKSLKEGIHILSPDSVLTRPDYNMSIAVEDVEGMGRYTEATAEGKKLLYGYPDARTSYTTIRIDGHDYYQDATMDSYVTQMPTIIGDSIITKWTLPSNVKVSQDLTLMSNTTRYRLTVTNNDHASHHVKIRYMFDTMLAYEDGAPFRVPGVGDITTEQEFKNPVFDYWKAMDSLANPTLISYCTFVPHNKPYKVQFAYWRAIYNVPFDYTITAGQSITGDTAVGMYWDLGNLVPGEIKDVIVYYGTAFDGGEDIRIMNLFTEFDNYLSSQPVRGYTHIANGGNVPLVDGQLAITITNPKDELVFETSSPITINPDQTISPGFTYNLPVDAVGGVYTINATIFDAEQNVLDQREAIFSVTAIDLSISPEGIVTSIGGSAKYEITVTNPSDIAVSLNLSLTGLDDSWYTLSKESLILNAGEEETVILNVTIPESPDNVGEYSFNVFVGAKSVSAVLNVGLEPVIYELSPPNDVIVSSNDVIFSWKTSVNSTTELYIKQETEADFTQVSGDSGLEHSVTVEDLTRNTNYIWHIRSCSAFGCAVSENRAFYIDNGIVFTQDIYEFRVERDYDQHCFVSVKNMDSEAHNLLVRAFNPYDDLYFGFIGGGSADRIISLASGETKDIELVIHAQDAMLENYTFTVNLTNLGAENITDYALVRVNVRHPHIDFNITEVSTDPITLSKTIRITNYGDPVTDLSITPDEKLKGDVIIQPSLAHCSLGTGESVDMVISPIWSEGIRYIHGTIAATVADESKELFVDYSCPEEKEMYPITLDHPILYFDLKGAWCINCHHVEDIFNFPPGFGSENVVYSYIGMELNAGSGQTRPYNVYIGTNGHRVGTLSNTFPSGYYGFDIDSSYLNYATAGTAENRYTLDTDMPGSYYTPLSNVRVVMCVDEIKLYICAESEEQAYDIAWSAPYIHKPSGSITVNIISPEDESTLTLFEPVLIKAEVLGDGEGEKLCKVIATFNNSDEEIVLVDNGLHDDGQADDGVYANTWVPKVLSSTKIIVSACNCIASTLDNVTLIPPKPPETKIVGRVTNTTNYPIENVDMYLYNAKEVYKVLDFIIDWFFDPTTPVPSSIRTTKTNITGNYNFTALTPGSYLVLAVPQFGTSYLPKASDSRAVAKNETEIINLQLDLIRYLATLDDEMKGIRDESIKIVDENTNITAYVYSDGANLIRGSGIEDYVFWIAIDSIDTALGYVATSPTAAIETIAKYVGGLIPGGVIGKYAGEKMAYAAAVHAKGTAEGGLKKYADQIKAQKWIENFEYSDSVQNAAKGFKKSDIYQNSSNNISSSFETYNKTLSYEKPVSGFSYSEVQSILDQQVDYLQGDIADGLIITPSGKVATFKTTRVHGDLYNDTKAVYKAIGWAKGASTAASMVGHGMIICSPAAGPGAPAVAAKGAIIAGIGKVGKVATTALSTIQLWQVGHEWANTQIYWTSDLDKIQEVNNDIIKWLDDQIENPTAFQDIDGVIIDTDIHATSIPLFTDKQIVFANTPDYPWWWILPKLRWWAVNNNTVIIKSVSSIDNVKTRTYCIDRYGSDVSKMLTIFPSAMEPPMPMNKDETKTFNLTYIGDFRVFNPFHWHHLSTILWMEGKQPDIETDVYYVIPLPFSPQPYAVPNKTTMSAQETNTLLNQPIRSEICAYTTAKSHSPITLEDWISLLGNCTKIIDTNLDPVNDSTQVQYTTNASITNVTFLMATIPGTHVDLHVYDEAGRRVGYDPITDSDEIQIPSGTYTGSDSNPEIITIPLAASKTFTISANATQFTSSSPTPVEIYAIETPVRPAVLGVSPMELYPFISPGETKNVTIQLAEVGKQVDIEEVIIIPRNFADVHGNSMLNVTISISPNNFNIDKGAVTFINLNLNAAEDIIFPSVPETRYTGNVTINTSNAGEINATLHVLLLDTDIPNAKLTFAESNVTGVHATSINLSEINETYKPPEVIPQSAYMINSTGAGNFTLKFTDIPNANTIAAYKINATNQWLALDTITTGNNVSFTMAVEDPHIVFASPEAIPPTITNLKPGNMTAESGDIINFSCFVTDNTEVESVWLNYTTDNWTTRNTKIIDNPYNDFYTLNLTLPETKGTGSFKYRVEANDTAGNVGNSSIYEITILVEPPVATNVNPGNITAMSSDIIEFNCTVTDNIAVESVWLNYTTTNWTAYSTKAMDNPYSDFYSTSLILPIVEVIEYKIEASDEAGNMGSSDIYTIKVLPTVTIELKEGWNMISLPLKPADLSASSVLRTIPNPAEDRFYIWNASKGEYDAIFGDMELELGRAYRINITADGTWRLSGTETHGVQVNLTHGRNMIGVPSPTNISATDINITVGTDTCNLVEAAKKGYIRGIFYSWNAANGKHDALVILSPDAKLMPGIGYFANVNQDCTITYP